MQDTKEPLKSMKKGHRAPEYQTQLYNHAEPTRQQDLNMSVLRGTNET